ncbi:MAG TPA: MFS transporter [Caulobacteraceae bacterium]
MTAQSLVAERKPIALGVAVVPLLALMIFIQYVDRGNIATAAPLMSKELGLDARQVGLLISAFYFTYAPSQLLTGWLAHRINAYRTLALGLAIWSLATFATGLVGGFAGLIALRLMLGLGESAAFPCSSRILARHLPSGRLGAANGLIGVGLALGPAIGTWAGGNLMAVSGWRPTFLIFGALSALWLLPWWRATRHLDRAERDEPEPPAPTYLEIIKRRDAWGAALGHFCNNYSFYFVLSWLPLYLVKTRGLSMGEMAEVGGVVYGVYALSCLASGWLGDQWMRAGASANLVRKSAAIAGNVIPGAALIVAAFGDTTMAIGCLIVAAVGSGIATNTIYSIGQTLAGPKAGGKWMAIQNGIGNLAGVIGPIITGVIVYQTGSFAWAFISAGAVGLVGALGWGVIIRKVEPLEWAPVGTMQTA